jgi:hypothetical protein
MPRHAIICDFPTEFEQRLMDRMNVAFKLYDVDAIITFEPSPNGIQRQLKPFVLDRRINSASIARRRYRRIKDLEQFAMTMLEEANPIEP